MVEKRAVLGLVLLLATLGLYQGTQNAEPDVASFKLHSGRVKMFKVKQKPWRPRTDVEVTPPPVEPTASPDVKPNAKEQPGGGVEEVGDGDAVKRFSINFDMRESEAREVLRESKYRGVETSRTAGANAVSESTVKSDSNAVTPEPTNPDMKDGVATSRTKMQDLDPSRHHWHLGVCASTAFSSEWLREWIELQLLAGVGHIWLINDNAPGVDNKTEEVIAYYEELGFVTSFGERLPSSLPGCGNYKNCIAPKLCHALVHQYVDQFIFADTDEFIFPTMGCDVSEHVRDNCDPNRAHHQIPWERFGTSGHYNMPRGLMIENFLASGGDCSAHAAANVSCVKKTWDFCSECRHVKSMYNTKCVGTEHVGHPHIPTNTTWYKEEPEHWAPDGRIVQPGNTSIWHHKTCKELTWNQNVATCKGFAYEAEGARFPPRPSQDCCVAGIGYNHYGTKSKSHWDFKMKTKTSRGLKPDFDVVEQNSTVASNVLRFARAMRQRWQLLGLDVAPGVNFYDNTAEKQSTFVEQGWRYKANPALGTRDEVIESAETAESCADACWVRDARPPATSRCGGWSFHKKERKCHIIHSPFNSWKDGEDLNYLRWPHTSFTAERVKNGDYVSGIPLHEGECPLPERLRKV